MRAQHAERVGVQRDGAPTAIGLAVLLDHRAVDDHAGWTDGQGAGVEVKAPPPAVTEPPQTRWRATATTATFVEAVRENEEVVPVNAVLTWVLPSGVTVGR